MTLCHVDCNVCGAKRYTLRFIYDGHNYVECAKCGLVFINPRQPDEAYDVIYNEAYYRSDSSLTCGYDDYLRNRAEIEETGRRRYRLLRRLAPPGPMLDVGCAFGFYMNVAREFGYRPVGLEISAYSAGYAREHFGHEVHHRSLKDATFADASFDLITMWDVLEHLTDPAAYIALCARFLRPGGVLSLITPDVSSLHARLMGRHWVEFQKPREHIYYFRRDNVHRLLDKNGFDVKHSGTAGKYVRLEFAFKRLRESLPFLSPVMGALERAPVAKRVLYVNPFDKMFVMGRKR